MGSVVFPGQHQRRWGRTGTDALCNSNNLWLLHSELGCFLGLLSVLFTPNQHFRQKEKWFCSLPSPDIREMGPHPEPLKQSRFMYRSDIWSSKRMQWKDLNGCNTTALNMELCSNTRKKQDLIQIPQLAFSVQDELMIYKYLLLLLLSVAVRGLRNLWCSRSQPELWKPLLIPQNQAPFTGRARQVTQGLKNSLAVVKGNCRTHTKIQMSKCRGRTNLPVHRQLPANPEPALQTCLNPSIVITQPLLDCSIRDEDFVLSRLHNRWQKEIQCC